MFDIIEGFPDRLREVDGIGPVRAASILSAWAEQKAVFVARPIIPRPRQDRALASGAQEPCILLENYYLPGDLEAHIPRFDALARLLR